MFELAGHTFDKPIFLAPMEDVTDLAYRIFCKRMGADMVYTEFVNSDGLVRGCKQSIKKIKIIEEERPIGIQIYGSDLENMVRSAELAAQQSPDLIDVNAGCWVKKVSRRGAGAGLLLNPPFMQKMIGDIVKRVSLPVTVKTRIGWDEANINIVEIAKRLEDVGVKALTIHCRTRSQGHSGEADWSWIEKVKREVSIPIILNGGIKKSEDVKLAFENTPADGVMVGRLAIGSPWVFKEMKEVLTHGRIINPFGLEKRFELCLEHLASFVELRGERAGVTAFRKYYSGYFKGEPGIAKVRNELMQIKDYETVKEFLLKQMEEVKDRGSSKDSNPVLV